MDSFHPRLKWVISVVGWRVVVTWKGECILKRIVWEYVTLSQVSLVMFRILSPTPYKNCLRCSEYDLKWTQCWLLQLSIEKQNVWIVCKLSLFKQLISSDLSQHTATHQVKNRLQTSDMSCPCQWKIWLDICRNDSYQV